jgi:hypothetical protein
MCAVTLQYRPPVGGGGLPAGQFLRIAGSAIMEYPASRVHGRWFIASTLLGLKPDEAILLLHLRGKCVFPSGLPRYRRSRNG